ASCGGPVHTFALRVDSTHPGDDAPSDPGRLVTIRNDVTLGYLLLPDSIDRARSYPLMTVFHGAGRQDELLVRAYRDEPARRDALFFIPRSTHPTWDLLVGQGRADLDFLEQAYAEIYRRLPVDHRRQALIDYSDGPGHALSVGLSDAHLLSACIR